MADFISELATKAGIDTGMAQKGLGALLSTLQTQVPAETFSKISSAIPNAGGLVSTFQTAAKTAEPNAASALTGLAGNLLGGKSEALSTLISQFSRAGFTMDSAKAFIPIALGLLKDRLPADVMKQVESAAPGVMSLVTSDAGGILGKIKSLF